MQLLLKLRFSSAQACVILADFGYLCVILADFGYTCVILADFGYTCVILADFGYTCVILADFGYTCVISADFGYTCVISADFGYPVYALWFYLLPEISKIIWLPIIFTWSVPDEGYSRNMSCALN
jgi:hypothetical protein